MTVPSKSQESNISIPSGASVETTTIIVSPVQSHAKTDATVDAATTMTSAGQQPTNTFGSADSASDISSQEYSAASDARVTVSSTHTVTFTIVSAGNGQPSSTGTLVTDVEGTAVSSVSAPSTATCITHTVVGPDGRTTIVESIFVESGSAPTPVGEASSVLAGSVPSASAHLTAPGLPIPSYESGITSGLPIHTSFITVGSDGKTSVVDTTWIIPVPPTSIMSGLGPMPSSGRLISGMPSNGASEQTQLPITSVMGTTTCTTLTVVGPNGMPTVSELTIIAPTAAPATTAATVAPPSFVAPPSMTDLASQPPVTSNSMVTTITWKVIGADGTVSPIIQTITVPSDSTVAGIPASLPSASSANLPLPPVVPAMTTSALPAYATAGAPIGGTQGLTSMHSVVSGIGSMPSFVPPPSVSSDSLPAAPPAYSLNSDLSLTYGSPIGLPTDGASPIPYGTESSDDGWISSILYGTLPSTPPPVTPVPVTPAPVTPEPATPFPTEPISTPGSPGAPEVVTSLVTSTWTNIIPESTTTYVMKFPLTTMVTMTVPRGPVLGRRLLKRQRYVSESVFVFDC